LKKNNIIKVCATFKDNEDNIVVRMNLIGIDEDINAVEFLKKNVIFINKNAKFIFTGGIYQILRNY
jgi:hypothetical protein